MIKNNTSLALKFVGLIIAIFIWEIMSDAMNPYTTVTYQIPVQIVKVSTNSDIERTFNISQSNTRITYNVRTNATRFVTSNDFYAYVEAHVDDVSGFKPIKVQYPEVDDVVVNVKIDPDKAYLNVDNLAQKRFSVSYTPVGELSSQDYAIGFVDLSPTEIYLNAASTVLESIEKVKIDIPLTGQSDTFSGVAELKYYDKNDNEITNLPDEIEKQSIDYRVVVFGTKTVPFNINIAGNVARGHSYAGVIAKPSHIVITASREALALIDSIDLPDIDITDITTNTDYRFNVQDVLPPNIRSINASNEIVVTVMVNNLGRDDEPPPIIMDRLHRVATTSGVIVPRKDDVSKSISPLINDEKIGE